MVVAPFERVPCEKTGRKSGILAHFRLESHFFRAISFGLTAFSPVSTARLYFATTRRRFFPALAAAGNRRRKSALFQEESRNGFP
jgi:hypothetical protein